MLTETELQNEFNVTDFDVRNDEFICACPKCGRKKHFYCNVKTGKFICFKCGHRGKLEAYSYLSDTEKLNDDMKGLLDLDVINFRKKDVFDLKDTLSAVFFEKAKEYLLSRGMTEEEIRERNIRYKNNCVIFPNTWDNFKTDMMVSRIFMGSSEKRYLFPYGSHPKSVVYNLQNIPKNPDYIIIVEGVINAIIAGKNAVALYSKFCSKEQFQQIIEREAKSIYVSLDFDAKQEAYDLGRKLAKNTNSEIFLVNFSDDRDVADLGREKFLDLVFNAVPVSDKLKISLDFF